MTRDEAIAILENSEYELSNQVGSKYCQKKYEALDMAIKALEQEPCEDCVSKASVFEIVGNLMSIPYDFDRTINEKDVSESMDKIRALPPVTPQKPILDKIKDYINYIKNTGMGKKKSLEFIEKYIDWLKAESEVEK